MVRSVSVLVRVCLCNRTFVLYMCMHIPFPRASAITLHVKCILFLDIIATLKYYPDIVTI